MHLIKKELLLSYTYEKKMDNRPQFNKFTHLYEAMYDALLVVNGDYARKRFRYDLVKLVLGDKR